jgi:hypothetical protein
MVRRSAAAIVGLSALAIAAVVDAQERRVASPSGSSATEVGGVYDARAGNVGGKRIEILYGRPMKRGRDLFGEGDFVEFLNDGAPLWRAGANLSTRLRTEAALEIGTTTVAPGEYTIFIELAREAWTLVVSAWPAQTRYDFENKEALFGAYDYTPDKDVVRTPMMVEELPYSFDQLTWQFLDMTESGGTLALFWDRKIASVAFRIED